MTPLSGGTGCQPVSSCVSQTRFDSPGHGIALALLLFVALTGCASVKPEAGKSAVVVDLRAEPRWRPATGDGGAYPADATVGGSQSPAGPQWELLDYDVL